MKWGNGVGPFPHFCVRRSGLFRRTPNLVKSLNQFWDTLGRYIPDALSQYFPVIVGYDISLRDDATPGDFRVGIAERLGDAPRRLTDNLYLTLYRGLYQSAGRVLILRKPFDEAS